jgi:hypothetical protein
MRAKKTENKQKKEEGGDGCNGELREGEMKQYEEGKREE